MFLKRSKSFGCNKRNEEIKNKGTDNKANN